MPQPDWINELLKFLFGGTALLGCIGVIWYLFNRRIEVIEAALERHEEECVNVRKEQRDSLDAIKDRAGTNAVVLAEMGGSVRALHDGFHRMESEVRLLRNSLINYGRRASDPPDTIS